MPTPVPAFPLQWPAAVPRTKRSAIKKSTFAKMHWDKAIARLKKSLTLLGASYITISTNQKLRLDWVPYAQQRDLDDAGVAVYFTLDGIQLCFPCDRWATLSENLRAITLHIDSLRGQARWGVGTTKQAFAGYKALTATAGEDEPWWTVLGILSTATVEQIREAHRAAALRAHPDRGGSADQMARINTARDRAMKDRYEQR